MIKLRYNRETKKIERIQRISPWWKFWKAEYKITNFRNS